MKFYLLLILSLVSKCFLFSQKAFTYNDSLRGSINEWRLYDVRYYNLSLEFFPSKKMIAGTLKMDFTAVENQSKIQIDLFQQMKINAITLNNKNVKFKRSENATFVEASINKGSKYSMTVEYEGKPIQAKNAPWDGGFVWKEDIEGNTWAGVACEGIGASLWWPNKDHLSDEPDSMEMHFTVPSDLVAVSNGNLTGIKEQKNNTKTYSWKVTYPINNYNITVYIGKYEHLQDLYKANDSSELALDYYVLPNHKAVAATHFKQVHKVLRAFEHYFGKYPFWKDGYALVECPYLGMEHQSAIAYGNEFKGGYLGKGILEELDFDYIILHETAHEYFGNSVSCTDLGDMWIHESFATYMEALFVEYYYGKDAAQRYLLSQKSLIKNTEPIFGPYGVNYEPLTSDQYYKGSWMLHSLRNTIENDTLWFSILHEFYDNHKIKSANRDDFINLVNRRTKKDYTAFIHQYLRWETPPTLEYRIDKKADLTLVYYRWKCIETSFEMPIEFNLDGHEIKVKPTNEWKSTQFARNFKSITPSFSKRYYQAIEVSK